MADQPKARKRTSSTPRPKATATGQSPLHELYRAAHFLLDHARIQNPEIDKQARIHQGLIAEEIKAHVVIEAAPPATPNEES